MIKELSFVSSNVSIIKLIVLLLTPARPNQIICIIDTNSIISRKVAQKYKNIFHKKWKNPGARWN